MTYCESKNDFCKKSGGLLFSAKVQSHSGSSEIGRKLCNQEMSDGSVMMV
jgi:hypothetical protein